MISKKKSEKSTFIEKPLESIVSHIGKAIDKAPDVFTGLTQSHPIVLALILMGGANVVRCFLEPGERSDLMLDGLYIDARNIAIAAAAVPIIAGGFNILTQALAAMKGKD